MKKYFIIFIFTLSSLISYSEEGMIIPTLLGAFESDMQAMGMKLSASDIYDANNASIKDAIIHFGGGCTAEIVSNTGLLLTNHHCGFSQIYSHSTVENNIAKYGFWAKNHEEELPNPGLTAARMVRIVDVTARVLEGTEGLSPQEEFQKIQANIALIKAAELEGTHYEADIKPFDYGNSYYLLLKETFRDVRLVGTPPKTVGKFGGDTDNWVWPRHTGDFSVFRIYANEENKPADFNASNKPYIPLHFLPISLKKRKKDDFTMVFGFPGSTNQHTISTELDFIINTMRPAQIKMRDLSLSVINSAISKSEKTEIQYASKQARIANAWKKWIGQIDGLKRGKAISKKITFEDAYSEKAMSSENWKDEFSTVVSALRELAKKHNKDEFAYQLFIEYVYVGAEVFKRSRAIDELVELYRAEKFDELNESIERQKSGVDGFYKNYDVAIDREIFRLQTAYYKSILGEDQLPALIRDNSAEELTDMIYQKSKLVSKEGYLSLLNKFEKLTKKKLYKDPGYQLFNQLSDVFEQNVLPELRTFYGAKNQLMKS